VVAGLDAEAPAAARPARPGGPLYAGFWRRLVAYLIDMGLLVAVQGAIALAVLVSDPGDLQAVANLSLIGAALTWAYFTVLESSPMRATVGKLAMSAYVADEHGDPLTFARANARYFLKFIAIVLVNLLGVLAVFTPMRQLLGPLIVAGLLLQYLGWATAAFTSQKQALHDVLAGTLVLRRQPAQASAEAATRPFTEQWDGSRWVRR